MEHSRKRQSGFLEFTASSSDYDVWMREEMSNYFCVSPLARDNGGCVKVAIVSLWLQVGSLLSTSVTAWHLRRRRIKRKNEILHSDIYHNELKSRRKPSPNIGGSEACSLCSDHRSTTSIYRWKGKMENPGMALPDQNTGWSFQKVEQRLKKCTLMKHRRSSPYRLLKGARNYLNWLDDETVNKIIIKPKAAAHPTPVPASFICTHLFYDLLKLYLLLVFL